MDTVEFHTGIEDPVAFSLRLLGKAYRQGARVLVTGQLPTLEAISRQLWLVPEREFVAHVLLDRCTPAQALRTPLWLAFVATGQSGEPDVLLNVDAPAPASTARLQRLIEVVGAEAEAAAAGRQRWRNYKLAGLQVQHVTGASRSES